MTYWNPVLQYGVDGFADDLAAAGGAGLITPDLIPDEAADWIAASERTGLDRVFLAAPSSTAERPHDGPSRRAAASSTRVSTMGITGARAECRCAARGLVAAPACGRRRQRLRRHRHLDTATGRGDPRLRRRRDRRLRAGRGAARRGSRRPSAHAHRRARGRQVSRMSSPCSTGRQPTCWPAIPEPAGGVYISTSGRSRIHAYALCILDRHRRRHVDDQQRWPDQARCRARRSSSTSALGRCRSASSARASTTCSPTPATTSLNGRSRIWCASRTSGRAASPSSVPPRWRRRCVDRLPADRHPVLDLRRRAGPRHAARPGDGPLRQLVQPRAVRHADRPALGPGDRSETLQLPRRASGRHPVPPDVPLRDHLELLGVASSCCRWSASSAALGHACSGLPDLVRRGPQHLGVDPHRPEREFILGIGLRCTCGSASAWSSWADRPDLRARQAASAAGSGHLPPGREPKDRTRSARPWQP